MRPILSFLCLHIFREDSLRVAVPTPWLHVAYREGYRFQYMTSLPVSFLFGLYLELSRLHHCLVSRCTESFLKTQVPFCVLFSVGFACESETLCQIRYLMPVPVKFLS